MSNQGYFLDAGFIDEAEDIADKALKLENPHANIFALKIENWKISRKVRRKRKKWEELHLTLQRHKLILESTPINIIKVSFLSWSVSGS